MLVSVTIALPSSTGGDTYYTVLWVAKLYVETSMPVLLKHNHVKKKKTVGLGLVGVRVQTQASSGWRR